MDHNIEPLIVEQLSSIFLINHIAQQIFDYYGGFSVNINYLLYVYVNVILLIIIANKKLISYLTIAMAIIRIFLYDPENSFFL